MLCPAWCSQKLLVPQRSYSLSVRSSVRSTLQIRVFLELDPTCYLIFNFTVVKKILLKLEHNSKWRKQHVEMYIYICRVFSWFLKPFRICHCNCGIECFDCKKLFIWYGNHIVQQSCSDFQNNFRYSSFRCLNVLMS